MFELDGIDTINVDTVETETNTDNSQIVFGQMTLNVLLKGFCVNNGEKQHNGNFPLTMIYTYTFDYYRGKYENLYLEYVD